MNPSFQDSELAVIDRVCEAAWAQVEARDPQRDGAKDDERRAALRKRVRAAWHKPDGTVVHFLCFEEQLAIVDPGATVHVVGNATELQRFKHKMVKLAA